MDLILTREFPPQDGGISIVAYEIANHLHKNGNDVQVLCWSYDSLKFGNRFNDFAQSFKILRLKQPRNRVFQIGILVFKLFEIHSQNPITRILATSWNFSGVAAAVFSKFSKIPFDVLTHGYEVSPPALKPFDECLLRFALDRANRIYAVSEYTKRLVQRFISSKKHVEVVPNGIDAGKFKPNPAGVDEFRNRFQLQDKKVLLTVARLFPRKGHDYVLKALPEIAKKIPNIHYLIAGSGPELQNLKRLAESLSVSHRVTFAGYIEDRDLPACYASCDLFILPNRVIDDPKDAWVGDFEGYGVVFNEASAAAKPVIAGNSGGAPDAVIDGVTGFLVPPENTQAIALKVIELLMNPDLMKKIGMQGRERVEKELDWPILLKKYEASRGNY